MQEEETGELLRVFEEHQSDSQGSGSRGGSRGGSHGGSHDRPPPHRAPSGGSFASGASR